LRLLRYTAAVVHRRPAECSGGIGPSSGVTGVSFTAVAAAGDAKSRRVPVVALTVHRSVARLDAVYELTRAPVDANTALEPMCTMLRESGGVATTVPGVNAWIVVVVVVVVVVRRLSLPAVCIVRLWLPVSASGGLWRVEVRLRHETRRGAQEFVLRAVIGHRDRDRRGALVPRLTTVVNDSIPAVDVEASCVAEGGVH